jgi:hypothetical protein
MDRSPGCCPLLSQDGSHDSGYLTKSMTCHARQALFQARDATAMPTERNFFDPENKAARSRFLHLFYRFSAVK